MKNKFTLFMFIICCLISLSATSSQASHQDKQLVIRFDSTIDAIEKQKLIQSMGGIAESRSYNGTTYLVTFPAKHNVTKIKETLLTSDKVLSVEPNVKATTNFIPTDKHYTKQWYAKKINLPKAWDASLGLSTIKVAVIDAGVQTSHPELKANIIKPYNAVTGRSTIHPDEHGTHVSGIIAAERNKTGIIGVAPNVKVIPINVFKNDEADLFTIIDGIEYAVSEGANIINLSLTMNDYTSALNSTIQAAHKKGVLIIAAAGNENTKKPQYPAALKNVIAVSATTPGDKRASFSNYGSYIDISAPGMGIYSTIPNNSYGYLDGTSMATPIVSGVAALILSKNPFLTPAEIESILKKSSKDLGEKGKDSYFGYGRVDAYNALSITPMPITKLSISKKKMSSADTKPIKIITTVKHSGKIYLYVRDSEGKLVKQFVMKKTWKGGQLSESWDGIMDNEEVAPKGKYTIIVKLKNSHYSSAKKASITIQ